MTGSKFSYTPPESLTAQRWKYLPNRKVVFRPPFFRGELLNFQWGNPSGWDPVGGLYGKKSWQWTVFFKCEEKCRVYRHHPQKKAGIFKVWWTISILSTWYKYIDVCCINRKRTWLECTWIFWLMSPIHLGSGLFRSCNLWKDRTVVQPSSFRCFYIAMDENNVTLPHGLPPTPRKKK